MEDSKGNKIVVEKSNGSPALFAAIVAMFYGWVGLAVWGQYCDSTLFVASGIIGGVITTIAALSSGSGASASVENANIK